MQKTIDNSGVYILEIYAPSSFSIGIKKYAGRIFKSGYYYYTGSAQKNLKQRIERHLRKKKKKHWHIDHLTAYKSAEIKRIFILLKKKKFLECRISNQISKITGVAVAAGGFGNSDCDQCESHLYYSSRRLNQSHFTSRYQSTVCLIPSSREIF